MGDRIIKLYLQKNSSKLLIVLMGRMNYSHFCLKQPRSMHSVIIPTQACHPTLPYQPSKRCVLTNSRPTHDNLTKKSVRQKLKKRRLSYQRTTGRERPSSKTLDRALNLCIFYQIVFGYSYACSKKERKRPKIVVVLFSV